MMVTYLHDGQGETDSYKAGFSLQLAAAIASYATFLPFF